MEMYVKLFEMYGHVEVERKHSRTLQMALHQKGYYADMLHVETTSRGKTVKIKKK